jgi:hypothetical protein
MTNESLDLIASQINSRAEGYQIGRLQEIRKELKGLKRHPTKNIFTAATISEQWAFHHGGRREIQFNIGIIKDTNKLRYGVAFSLETSQTLPKIDIFVPKIKLFNDFIQAYPEQYADMRMWHYYDGQRSHDYTPTSIPLELMIEGVFIFLGQRQSLDRLDYDAILSCFDRLLPLYKYIESKGMLPPVSTATIRPFEFQSGFVPKVSSARASLPERELDINLRHNIFQEALYNKLVEKYGADNVGGELQSGVGTNIDIVVRHRDQFHFYEIKTAKSPRICLRQALGQLLEYAFWPGSQEATRLVVVGETALDDEGAKYLLELKKRFSLPLEYEHIVVE